MKHLLILLFAFFQTSDWKALDDKEFSVKYPSSWEVNQSGIMGTKFILFAPSSPAVAFRDNINLGIQDLNGMNMDLKKFVELSSAQIKQLVTNGNILTSETSVEKQRHKIVYSGSQGQLNLKWQQYYWIKNEKAYVLTFTADQNTFDKGVETANRVMDSFTVK